MDSLKNESIKPLQNEKLVLDTNEQHTLEKQQFYAIHIFVRGPLKAIYEGSIINFVCT